MANTRPAAPKTDVHSRVRQDPGGADKGQGHHSHPNPNSNTCASTLTLTLTLTLTPNPNPNPNPKQTYTGECNKMLVALTRDRAITLTL